MSKRRLSRLQALGTRVLSLLVHSVEHELVLAACVAFDWVASAVRSTSA